MISLRSRENLEDLERRFGISIRPREKPIEAPPCPDHGKLDQDFALILASARERNNYECSMLARHLERMADIFHSFVRS